MAKKKIKGKGILIKEIELPQDTNASVQAQTLVVKGPKGEVRRELKQGGVSIKIVDKKILLESSRNTKRDKKQLGSLEAHVKNMIKGCLHSHTYVLKICSGHFPMNVSVGNGKLVIKNFFGEKVPRVLNLSHKVEVKVEGDLIRVTSPSKEIAGQAAADIEQLTRRPGFDSRIFQDGCYIISKDGKELK